MTVSFNKNDCKFPFTYNEEQYNDCTKVDNWGVPWCCTSSVIPCDDDDAPWINCEESKFCKFPTTYKGKSYDSCTFVDNDGGVIPQMVHGEIVMKIPVKLTKICVSFIIILCFKHLL